jgi:hypothetical protein
VLLYGTPSEFNTGSNESMHKPSKYAVKLTQRIESTFNQQTTQRLTEFLTIDFALSEAEQGRKIWKYFDSVEKVWDGNLDDSSAEEDAEMRIMQLISQMMMRSKRQRSWKGTQVGVEFKFGEIEKINQIGHFWVARRVPFHTSSGQRR